MLATFLMNEMNNAPLTLNPSPNQKLPYSTWVFLLVAPMVRVLRAWLLASLLRVSQTEEAIEDTGVRCQYRKVKDKAPLKNLEVCNLDV